MSTAIALTLPTIGASRDTWAATNHIAMNQMNTYIVGAWKTGTEAVTSSTTLQNDDNLVCAVVASGVYVAQWRLRTDGATTGDLKYAFTGPSGATMTWESRGLAAADVANVAMVSTDVAAIGTTVTHGTLGAGTTLTVLGTGLLVVSVTAGNLQLQWAQGTSSGTATNVFAGSWLRGPTSPRWSTPGARSRSAGAGRTRGPLWTRPARSSS